MIIVIADDISGAAEIAGVARRFGLTAQVQRRFSPAERVDIVVVSTNTRDTTEDVARITLGALARELSDADVLWCYKKVDSVLRGHVCAELEVLMSTLQKPRVILAPANPSKGRTIVGGRYYIDNRPLHETEFARDPQYPVKSSLVTDLLGDSSGCPVLVSKHDAYQGCEKGIIVAEAESQEHLSHWAAKVTGDTLTAGGSDFFSAVLARWTSATMLKPASEIVRWTGPRLFICGSASDYSREAVRRGQRLGVLVCPMPDLLFGQDASPGPLMNRWIEDVLDAVRVERRVVVAVTQPVVTDVQLGCRLSACIATLVESVVAGASLGELILEGGATAEAILARLGWVTLTVVGEYGPGVVQLRVSDPNNPLVTIKPGSYPWPAGIWGQCREGTSYAT